MRSHRLLGLLTSTVLLSLIVPSPFSLSFKESTALAQDVGEGDRQAEADALFDRSVQFWQRGDYQQALSMLQRAFEIYREIGDRRGEGRSVTGLGAIAYSVGQYSQALDYYQQALEINVETGDRSREVTILTGIGLVYSNLGDYQQALDYYQQALAIRTEVGDRAGEGATLNNIGEMYFKLGQYEQAFDYFQQALAIHAEGGNSPGERFRQRRGEGTTLNNIGLVYIHLGQYSQALDYYQQALIIRTEVGDRAGEGTTLNNIGGVYANLGQYSQALDYYQQALAIKTDIGDRRGEGTTLNNIGGVYVNLGQYFQALDYYQQALAIKTDIGDRFGEGVTLNNIGLVYDNLGRYSQALDYYQQALAIRTEVGDRFGEGVTLNNIGSVYDILGQYSQALDHYQQALAIKTDIGDRAGEGATLNNIGGVYDSLGQYSQALDYYQQALAITIEIGDRAGEGTTLNNTGLVYRNLGQYQQALEYLQQALAIRTEVGDQSGKGITLNNIGHLFDTQDQPELAIVFLKQSVNTREQIRGGIQQLDQALQQSYTDTVSHTYRRLADLLVSQGRLLEALQVIELLKLQEIRDYTRSGVASREVDQFPEEETTAAAYYDLIQLGSAILTCESDPECGQQELTRLKQQRTERNTAYNDAVRTLETAMSQRRAADDQAPDPQDLIYEDVQKIVEAQPGTVLIYPIVLDDRLLIMWATQGGLAEPIYVEGVSEEQINQAVFRFHELMAQCELGRCSPVSEIQAVSQQLYDWLMPAQLREQLEQNDIQNLVFALDRSVRYIPMAALFDGSQYLIENYTVSTVTAAWLSHADTPLPQDPNAISVMALGLSEAVPDVDPADDVFGFRGLRYVPDELDVIVQRGDRTDEVGIYSGQELLNSQFDKNVFYSLAGHNILHIATHGVYMPTNLYSSYLMLGTKEDWRISQIQDIGAEFRSLSMVVLSACETALGGRSSNQAAVSELDGREISGIAQTFIDAGVDTVVASLWQVNDASTSQLMQSFYHNLAENTADNPGTIAQALRDAQLSLLRGEETGDRSDDRGIAIEPNPEELDTDEGQSTAQSSQTRFSHPYYWAPFILIGNGL
ncbi:MAG: CHAT domain-containing protein [Elainellaceae cyanobacterium]